MEFLLGVYQNKTDQDLPDVVSYNRIVTARGINLPVNQNQLHLSRSLGRVR